jgi:hypothetical protein
MGITHFSFTVPDTEALLEELLAKGAQLAGPRESFTNVTGYAFCKCKYSSNPWQEVNGGTPRHHGARIDRARCSSNS